MQVSFIIPLFNCLALTRACVETLQATLPAGLSHEIILVDDGSTDGTREWLATLTSPFRVVLNERNLGYAIANNRGAGVAQGEFLALLNNDLILLPQWLQPMIQAHRRLGHQAGVIGNVQLDAVSDVVDHAGIVINRQGKPVHDRRPPSRLSRAFCGMRRVPAVTGACLLITRALWQQLGGFDEAYINGGEDIELCFQARAAAASMQSPCAAWFGITSVRRSVANAGTRKIHTASRAAGAASSSRWRMKQRGTGAANISKV
jgi:O-antigen biosynthesis protein